jgi:hypothetical protein
MMSQTSANVDANVNPVYADVIKVKLFQDSTYPEMVTKGWRDWSLEDIIRILKDMVKSGKYYGVSGVEMGNIVFRKLLEAAADPNVPFEVIEEIVHTALEAPALMNKFSVLYGFYTFNTQGVCDFFKEFVKRGIDDARYYDLIYTMLIHRIGGGFPLGFAMRQQNGFDDGVLAKLPLEMQEQLKSESFARDDEDTGRRICYSILTGESVAM